jgi:hypothetical protein
VVGALIAGPLKSGQKGREDSRAMFKVRYHYEGRFRDVLGQELGSRSHNFNL